MTEFQTKNIQTYLESSNSNILCTCTICIIYETADINVVSLNNLNKTKAIFRDAPTRFGAEMSAEGLKGAVVVVEPPEACQDIQPPPNDTRYQSNNWTVLISRKNFIFEAKIRAAQKADFDIAFAKESLNTYPIHRHSI